MDFLADISEARQAITGFLMGDAATLPSDLRDRLMVEASSASPVDQIARTAELLYANKEDAGQQGRNLCAKLSHFGGLNGWHNLRDGRGTAMCWAMMRRNGLDAPAGITFQDESDDPEPLAEFVPPTPAPAPAE